jgi:hypothetical protein
MRRTDRASRQHPAPAPRDRATNHRAWTGAATSGVTSIPTAALELMAGPFLARVFADLDRGPRRRRAAFETWWEILRERGQMIKFTVGTEIARPPTDVFAYVTDAAKLATWQTNTISAVTEDDTPIALGTRVRGAPSPKRPHTTPRPTAPEPHLQAPVRPLLHHRQTGAREHPADDVITTGTGRPPIRRPPGPDT